MQIEAFSEGKYLDAPEANEDQFLVLPGLGYAVFDGVTAPSAESNMFGMRSPGSGSSSLPQSSS